MVSGILDQQHKGAIKVAVCLGVARRRRGLPRHLGEVRERTDLNEIPINHILVGGYDPGPMSKRQVTQFEHP